MSVALQIALLLSIVFSIHLFPVFKLIPTSRRICMHIRTYVCPTSWFLRSFNTTLPRCRGQTATRMEEGIGRRTWAYGRIGLLFPSLSLYHLQHHHACISAPNASHGRSGNTPTHTQRERGEVRRKAWGLSGGKWARSASGQAGQVRDEQGWRGAKGIACLWRTSDALEGALSLSHTHTQPKKYYRVLEPDDGRSIRVCLK
jgi:hypothetical protein